MNESSHIPGDNSAEPSRADLAAGHEVSDVSIRGLVVFLVGLVVSLGIIVFAVAWMFQALENRARRNDPAPPPLAELRVNEPPGPRLQPSPSGDTEELRKRQEAQLRETKWIDREQKIARIPIDRAMRRIAERGLPDWPPVMEQSEKQKNEPPSAPGERPAKENR